jgi:hypothetical protein
MPMTATEFTRRKALSDWLKHGLIGCIVAGISVFARLGSDGVPTFADGSLVRIAEATTCNAS